MRTLRTGVDARGRSCLVEAVPVVPEPPPEGGYGVEVARILSSSDRAPGGLRWLVVDHPAYDPAGPPSTSVPLHPSDTLDLAFVHEGGGDLVLQDGAHPVSAGDVIVMPGVVHALRGGPEGCRLLVVRVSQ